MILLWEILFGFLAIIATISYFYKWRNALPQDSLSVDNALEKTSILAARKDKLETASQQWKKRVEVSDALTFSVAGRMTQEAKDLSLSPLTVTAPADKKKRTPKPTRFRGREGKIFIILFEGSTQQGHCTILLHNSRHRFYKLQNTY